MVVFEPLHQERPRNGPLLRHPSILSSTIPDDDGCLLRRVHPFIILDCHTTLEQSPEFKAMDKCPRHGFYCLNYSKYVGWCRSFGDRNNRIHN